MGWAPVRDLDIKGSAAVVRMLAAASSHKKEPNLFFCAGVAANGEELRGFARSRRSIIDMVGAPMEMVRGV